MLRHYLVLIIALCFLASCEKAEDPIVLPPPGTATHGTVDLGPNYEKQVYFNFETMGSVFSSDPLAWDLAFEASQGGRQVFINGGNQVYLYNTHKTLLSDVTELPAGMTAISYTGWQYDDPTLQPSGTAVGEWWQSGGSSKGEVYLLQTIQGVNKLRVLSGDDNGYTIEWLPLYGTGNPTQVQLLKDTTYNFVYFSFTKGILSLEPKKDTWDIVFTRCMDSIFASSPPPGKMVPYVVTGVLTNPYRTRAGADSVNDFSTIDLNKALAMTMSENRLVIGYDWKTYNFSTGYYQVNRRKNYVVQTRKDQLYKLRFLDFYSSTGAKGVPSFEYERLK
jgi:hypothetical protein